MNRPLAGHHHLFPPPSLKDNTCVKQASYLSISSARQSEIVGHFPRFDIQPDVLLVEDHGNRLNPRGDGVPTVTSGNKRRGEEERVQ